MLMLLNSLMKGKIGTTTENRAPRRHLIGGVASEAQQRAIQRVMSESYRLERGRGGGQHLIGVQALAELLHVGQDEVYGLKKSKKVHAQMVAADIDEPTENNVVELLENLPWEERE